MALASWDDTNTGLVHEDPRLLRALDMVAPGTTLREGIESNAKLRRLLARFRCREL